VALKIIKVANLSSADLLKKFQKDLGEEIGSFGGKLIDATRVPTGLFELDIALAGGFPRGKVSIIYGPESSNKTNIVLRAIANHQRQWPDKVCVFIDVEHAFDPAWARLLGVNTDKLIVISPAYAEQAVDIAESFLYADDCGIVAIDSLAALTSSAELEKSAEIGSPGGAAKIIGLLTRKTNAALVAASKKGNLPTLIYINQITYKIGAYGDPEVMPGGKKPYYQASLIIRVYGKNIVDTKINSALPSSKEVSVIVKKFKCPILNLNCKFEMVTIPNNGLKIGQCNDFSSIKDYLNNFGSFEKADKKGWMILDQHYPLIEDFKKKVYGDAKFGAEVRDAIIQRLLAESLIVPDETNNDGIVEELVFTDD
jgi:recombination protein RecA